MDQLSLDEKYPLRPTYFDAPIPAHVSNQSAYPIDAYGNYLGSYPQFQNQTYKAPIEGQYQVIIFRNDESSLMSHQSK